MREELFRKNIIEANLLLENKTGKLSCIQMSLFDE